MNLTKLDESILVEIREDVLEDWREAARVNDVEAALAFRRLYDLLAEAAALTGRLARDDGEQ